jgi:uncharacterized membrane protein (DUF485 family)
MGSFGRNSVHVFRLHTDHRFRPQAARGPIGAGVTTVGIPVGLLVIVSAFVLTGVYVRRANAEFDYLTRQILERAK